MSMVKHRKIQSISSLKDGDTIDDIFVVKIKKSLMPYLKGFSFQLILTDNSGRSIEYKYWGSSDEKTVRAIHDLVNENDVIKIKGKVGRYNENLQISANPPEHTLEVLREGDYDVSDFIRPAKRDTNQMYDEMLSYIEQIENVAIKKFLVGMFNNEALREKFKTHPGAIEIHHNWVGGLLEHTLQILNYCELSWKLFPELSKDLLIAGSILHDIGKLRELEVTSRIRGSIEGQLIGHTTLGVMDIMNDLGKSEIEKEIQTKLLHMIVSHLGKAEWGAGKPPMFPEAEVLHHADNMSSRISTMIEFVKDSKETTKNEFNYHSRENKNIFLR